MKASVAPYETAVTCLRIVCANGTTFRLARYPFALTMSNATVYESASGYDFSSVIVETAFSASAIDLEGFITAGGVTREQIASGLFDGAECFLFATDFLTPVEDDEPLMKSTLGKTTLDDDRFTIEDMSIVDKLNQTVGWTHSAQCPNDFGGQEYGGCQVDLGPITVTGAVTSVGSTLQFTDSSRTEDADHFAWGWITFTSGSNAGLRAIKVRDYAAGVFTLYDPPYFPIIAGVTYSAVPGCRKRLVDCQRHNNVVRFGGDLYVPVGSTYKAIGGATP
jgi:uncharacterized phage protein (TIGR02218 family)